MTVNSWCDIDMPDALGLTVILSGRYFSMANINVNRVLIGIANRVNIVREFNMISENIQLSMPGK